MDKKLSRMNDAVFKSEQNAKVSLDQISKAKNEANEFEKVKKNQ